MAECILFQNAIEQGEDGKGNIILCDVKLLSLSLSEKDFIEQDASIVMSRMLSYSKGRYEIKKKGEIIEVIFLPDGGCEKKK